MPDFNDTALETQLRRFLYIGKEKPEYQPGNWFVHKYYLAKNLPFINELAANHLKHDAIISSIVEAQDKGLVQNPETLIFALAMCAQQEVAENLRKKAYEAVKQLCKSPKYFILFNKFCSQINKNKVIPKTGWGHGWKKAVKDWYLSKTPYELARIVIECKGRYGWKHKDILKLAHVSPKEDFAIVFNYILFGFEKVKEMLSNQCKGEVANNNVLKIIELLKIIEIFRKCKDEHISEILIRRQKLNIHHVPGHMLKSEIIWKSLILSMSLTELLKNLQRIYDLHFLKPNDAITVRITSVLNKVNVIREKIHPAVFLVTLKNYENSGRPLSFEKRKVRERAKKPLPTPPKIDKRLVGALNRMLNFSFSQLPTTNVNYFITMKTNKTMLESGCWHCSNVKAAEAGCLIALSLLYAERNVTVATFVNFGIQCINVDTNSTLLKMMRKLEFKTVENIDLGKPMQWATEHNKSIDVFINIVDEICEKTDTSEQNIILYRRKMNLPNAKLVNCAMCASSTYNKENYDKNILSICGFDEKVPKIIEAFARSYF